MIELFKYALVLIICCLFVNGAETQSTFPKSVESSKALFNIISPESTSILIYDGKEPHRIFIYGILGILVLNTAYKMLTKEILSYCSQFQFFILLFGTILLAGFHNAYAITYSKGVIKILKRITLKWGSRITAIYGVFIIILYLIYFWRKCTLEDEAIQVYEVFKPWKVLMPSVSSKKSKKQTLVHDPENRIIRAVPYRRKRFITRLYVWPFLCCYFAWINWMLQSHPSWEIFLAHGDFTPLRLSFGLNFMVVLMNMSSMKLHMALTYYEVRAANEADVIFIEPLPDSGVCTICPLTHVLLRKDEPHCLSFKFQEQRYFYDSLHQSFFLQEYPEQSSYKTYLDSQGLDSPESISFSRRYYGRNRIWIPKPRFFPVFLKSLVKPSFLASGFGILVLFLNGAYGKVLFNLWCKIGTEAMITYSKVNLFTSSIKQTESCNLEVYRNGEFIEMNSSELLPRDLFSLPLNKHLIIPCDCLLTQGSVNLNEVRLSGESVTITKESVQSRRITTDLYDMKGDGKKHTLFSGTILLKAISPDSSSDTRKRGFKGPFQGRVLAVVIKTGFNKSEGIVTRKTIFENVMPSNEEGKALSFLLVVGLLSLLYSFGLFLYNMTLKPGLDKFQELLKLSMLMTDLVPQNMGLHIGSFLSCSSMSLIAYHIFCQNSNSLSSAGKIDVCCFDKTGTLTLSAITFDGLDDGLGDGAHINRLNQGWEKNFHVAIMLATCHSLTKDNYDTGEPMEKCVFDKLKQLSFTINSDGSISNSGKNKTYRIRIRHAFENVGKKMSVVVRLPNGQHIAIVKGSPEHMVPSIIQGQLPPNYDEVCKFYTKQGKRVIALAFKEINVTESEPEETQFERGNVESGLTFSNFIIYNNPEKPDARATMIQLRDSGHKLCIITGDGPFTAVYIAKTVGLISQQQFISIIELDGNNIKITYDDQHQKEHSSTIPLNNIQNGFLAFSRAHPDYSRHFAITNDVFMALMIDPHKNWFSTDTKEQVIIMFKELGLFVIMCGDGGNDSSALKKSHIGIGLTNEPKKQPLSFSGLSHRARKNKELNTTLNAPFIADSDSIDCVLTVIKYGRISLLNIVFNYKIVLADIFIKAYCYLLSTYYSLPKWNLVSPGNYMLGTCVRFILDFSQPAEEFSSKRPDPSLFSLYPLMNAFCQICIHFSFIYYYLNSSIIKDTKLQGTVENSPSFIADETFFLSSFIQINGFLGFFENSPFRRSMTKDPIVIVFFIMIYVVHLLLLFNAAPAIVYQVLGFNSILYSSRIKIMTFSMLHLLVSIFYNWTFRYFAPPVRSTRIE